jgi:hypothetical protein
MDDRDLDNREIAPHARLAAEIAAHFERRPSDERADDQLDDEPDDADPAPGEQYELEHDLSPPSAGDDQPAADQAKPPRGRPFAKGASGNPGGRPKGSRNKATLRVQEQIDERTDDLIERLIAKALEGNVAALKFCLDRVLPRTRARPAPMSLDLPQLGTVAGCNQAHVALIGAVADGELAPADARTMAALIDSHRHRADGEPEAIAARRALVTQLLAGRDADA